MNKIQLDRNDIEVNQMWMSLFLMGNLRMQLLQILMSFLADIERNWSQLKLFRLSIRHTGRFHLQFRLSMSQASMLF
jgi:hypothetical protein